MLDPITNKPITRREGLVIGASLAAASFAGFTAWRKYNPAFIPEKDLTLEDASRIAAEVLEASVHMTHKGGDKIVIVVTNVHTPDTYQKVHRDMLELRNRIGFSIIGLEGILEPYSEKNMPDLVQKIEKLHPKARFTNNIWATDILKADSRFETLGFETWEDLYLATLLKEFNGCFDQIAVGMSQADFKEGKIGLPISVNGEVLETWARFFAAQNELAKLYPGLLKRLCPEDFTPLETVSGKKLLTFYSDEDIEALYNAKDSVDFIFDEMTIKSRSQSAAEILVKLMEKNDSRVALLEFGFGHTLDAGGKLKPVQDHLADLGVSVIVLDPEIVNFEMQKAREMAQDYAESLMGQKLERIE